MISDPRFDTKFIACDMAVKGLLAGDNLLEIDKVEVPVFWVMPSGAVLDTTGRTKTEEITYPSYSIRRVEVIPDWRRWYEWEEFVEYSTDEKRARISKAAEPVTITYRIVCHAQSERRVLRLYAYLRSKTTKFAPLSTSAICLGSPSLRGGVDLSANKYISLEIDGTSYSNIDCSSGASDVTKVTSLEIADAINTDVGATVAYRIGNYVQIVSPTAGTDSSIGFVAPTSGDATETIFGLDPDWYPYEFAGDKERLELVDEVNLDDVEEGIKRRSLLYTVETRARFDFNGSTDYLVQTEEIEMDHLITAYTVYVRDNFGGGEVTEVA